MLCICFKTSNAVEDLARTGAQFRLSPIAKDHPRRIPEATVQKVLELRKNYHLGPQRIVWYMDRYHDTRISFSSVYRILVRNGVNRLPRQVGRRALHTRQYTAIDDATRVRALQIYQRHTQANAIRFFDYMFEKFPFRIHTVRTDRGHERQTRYEALKALLVHSKSVSVG